MPCDRRVPGAAAPTAAGGRRRKVMQARNREFRGLNAEREGGRPDFEVGKAGSNPVSAIKKRGAVKKHSSKIKKDLRFKMSQRSFFCVKINLK